MNKQIVAHDFDYYRRTIEKIYKDYYRNVLMWLSVLFCLEITLVFVGKWRGISVCIALIVSVLWLFIFKKYQEWDKFIENEMIGREVSVFSEDENYYYIPLENMTFPKKRSRNLISRENGVTFFIGVQSFNVLEPVHVRYYDMLEVTYTDKFKVTKTKVSYTRTRWKYRLSAWVAAIPAILIGGYILFFRVSFIGTFLINLFRSWL